MNTGRKIKNLKMAEDTTKKFHNTLDKSDNFILNCDCRAINKEKRLLI